MQENSWKSKRFYTSLDGLDKKWIKKQDSKNLYI